jgi:hypothetical protein
MTETRTGRGSGGESNCVQRFRVRKAKEVNAAVQSEEKSEEIWEARVAQREGRPAGSLRQRAADAKSAPVAAGREAGRGANGVRRCKVNEATQMANAGKQRSSKTAELGGRAEVGQSGPKTEASTGRRRRRAGPCHMATTRTTAGPAGSRYRGRRRAKLRIGAGNASANRTVRI